MKDLNIKTKKLKLFAKIKHTKLELLALLGPCCHQVIGSHKLAHHENTILHKERKNTLALKEERTT
jgi:hypothetical protein